jgi:hypothetical protein
MLARTIPYYLMRFGSIRDDFGAATQYSSRQLT